MLTEQERKWLEERKKRTQHCDTCPNRVGYYELCSSCRSRSLYGLSLCPDYRDAAEFEARVAVVAANGAQPCLQYDYNCPYGYAGDCPDNCDGNYNRFGTQATRCGLKHARLYVEEEMDNERNHA
nr:MAG TPA: hypothetical protein [Caudoviricetes sp.]